MIKVSNYYIYDTYKNIDSLKIINEKNCLLVRNFFIENNDRPEKYKRSYQIERIC